MTGWGATTALLLASCSASGTTGSEPASGDATSGRAESGTTSGLPSSVPLAYAAKEQAKAAYVAMWQDMAQAGRTSDWRSPKLATHATGDALSVMSRVLYADHRNGLVSKGGPKNHPEVTLASPSARPSTVMISDCGDSTDWLQYRKDTGELADDEPGGRRAITAEVKRMEDGTWKVTRFAVERLGSC
ncbi:hypothetical protein OHT76_05735 [Streptomyces sp. NBC_00287]|uniref:hypothetical protein n=1 Tax=Streptomyces sp. NBC_00287 TaxID=2975702 RepID=UPI002E2AFA68|nr:hypothetical protein [Streptomyces sp. NBC_00287]